MKILIARLNHETNTFSPVPTPIEAFAPTYGEAAYSANKGMRTAMAAFIDLAEAAGAMPPRGAAVVADVAEIAAEFM